MTSEMFIVCKERADGALLAGTPPKIHLSFDAARAEAERLTTHCIEPGAVFIVFKAFSRTARALAPVKTEIL